MREFVLPISKLKEFHNPSLSELCKSCPFYGRFFSCPPLTENLWEQLEKYKEVHIFIDDAKSLDERQKKQLEYDRKLSSEYELVFSSGKCIRCEHCRRETGESCNNFLYSAQTLNLNISPLREFLMGEGLNVDGMELFYFTAAPFSR